MAYVRLIPNQCTALDTQISDELGQKIFRMVIDEILGKAEGPQVGAHLSSCPIYDGQGGECNCLAEKLEIKPTTAQPSPGAATDQDLKERPAQPLTEAKERKQLENQPAQPQKKRFKKYKRDPRVIARGKVLLSEGKKPAKVKEQLEQEFDIELKYATVYQWLQDRTTKGKPPENPSPASSEGTGKVEPKKKPEKDKYAGFKIVPPQDNDLAIINDKVMCPKLKKGSVDVDDCRGGCGEYTCLIRHTKTKEPHVRCAAA